jgi:hypothetical protein
MISRRNFLGAAAGPALAYTDTRRDLIEDISRRAFLFFWEQADQHTGLMHDRASADGGYDTDGDRNVASIAANGFGLTAYCIGVERGWADLEEARRRTLVTLRFFAEHAKHENGWFYHFMNATSGERMWKSEVSSIDTALLLAGVLTARQYFADDAEIRGLAERIYRRIDFQWMLNGDRLLLSQGYHPEDGFIKSRWDTYCEHSILYLLAIGSPSFPISAESWRAWKRPLVSYAGLTFVSGGPLFTHQYSHAWVDFRGRREDAEMRLNYFENSIKATIAHRRFCMDLHGKFRGYSEDLWGITASDSAKGYVAWGGPPPDGAIDGSVVPCAVAGSLMFTPEICLSALAAMRNRFGPRIWKRYGFVDAFHPTNGWTNRDVIGIDLGISLLSAENLRSGNVWKWFARNPEITMALDRAGLVIV